MPNKIGLKLKKNKAGVEEYISPEYPTLYLSKDLGVGKEDVEKEFTLTITASLVGFSVDNNANKKAEDIRVEFALKDIIVEKKSSGKEAAVKAVKDKMEKK